MESEVIREKFAVEGMHCASCAASIESYLGKTPGIEEVSVNIVGHTAMIAYDPAMLNPGSIDQKVAEIGFHLSPADEAHSPTATSGRTQKVIISGILSAVVVTLAMFITVPGNAWIQWALSSVVLIYAGKEFFVNAWQKLIHRQVSMDTLVALSTGTAYAISTLNTFYPEFLSGRGVEPHLYFESAVVIITFILLGRMLEERAKDRTGEAVRQLIGLQPTTMTIRKDGELLTIDVKDAQPGDIAIVRPGERIPIDGSVINGETFIDESMISGEPVPERKQAGSKVYTGTINQQGYIEVKIEKIGSNTLINKIIKLVEEALSTKPPVQRRADKIAGYFVPAVLFLATLSALLWFWLGPAPIYALVVFMAVLVVACPCALGLATPTALTAGIGSAAQQGILIRNAAAMEKLREIDTLVLDKTGTLTYGNIAVTELQWKPGINVKEASTRWKTLEETSQHPIAIALQKQFTDLKSVLLFDIEGINSGGLRASFKGIPLIAGNSTTLNLNDVDLSVDWANIHESATYVYYAENGELIGVARVADKIRPNSSAVVNDMQQEGLEVIMLTGDTEVNAKVVAKETGIKDVRSSVRADQKGRIVEEIMKSGKVAMVGDGINDAHALAVADVGIALSTGTDIAMSSAEVTLLGKGIEHLPRLFRIARRTMQTVNQNLFWAFIYNLIAIPVAAGALYPFTGTLLSPMIAGAAMALSSLSVMVNSLRLKIQLN